MLVVEGKKKVVLDTPIYAQLVEAIPHAKVFSLDGKTLVAVNHGPEEAIVLKNLGLHIPEPIRSYFDWPGGFSPMEHQKDTAAFLTMHRRALCLNSPGTGKTLSTLWAAEYLMNEGVVHRVLVVAPLSTVNLVWGREIYRHLPHRSFELIVGSKAKRREKLANPSLQYAIINHDGFTHMHDELKNFDLVIYDEVTALKSPSSQRFRVFQNWMNKNDPWLWMLTGTPMSQNPPDVWTLARLAHSPHIPRSFTAFRDAVMNKISTFKWVARADALETCKRVLQPSIRFSLDECVDLPQTHYINRPTELSPVQQRAFEEMQEHSIVQFKQTDVSAANAAVMLGKLLQICCGVLYGNAGEQLAIDAGPRYDALTELIDEIGDKVIIFCPLRGAQAWLFDKLTAQGYDVAMVNGDTTKNERNSIFSDFQDTERIRILLAHPKVAAHGLTLTRAKDIIWYAPIYSLEQYEQANARIRRLNTSGKTSVWHIYATKFEAELYRRLQQKKRVLGDFLKLVQGVNDETSL